MVSPKRSILSCILIPFIAIAFLVLLSVNGYSAACCKNGVMSTCPDLGGGLSYDLSDCMLDLNPDIPTLKCLEKEVAMSNCGLCRVGQKCFQVVDCSYVCRFTVIDPGGGGELIPTCTAGTIQYKPDGSCGTKSQTCCNDNSWSGWGTSCPKTCAGVKPPEIQYCGSGGTQSRIVTCNGTTGEWEPGAWGTCVTPECTYGQTKVCPSNNKKVLFCTSAGKWSTYCECENEGNGVVYCHGMRLTTSQGSTCMHGIWSTETCSGICCCPGDTPKLMNTGHPGCWGRGSIGYSWQYACMCQRPDSGGGLLIN